MVGCFNKNDTGFWLLDTSAPSHKFCIPKITVIACCLPELTLVSARELGQAEPEGRGNLISKDCTGHVPRLFDEIASSLRSSQ
jgi:hypothetical protein